jgi:hypothetical protein
METAEHAKLKNLMCEKLEEWYGVSISEYASTGHELDAFSISTNGVRLMVEIIWSPSTTNFYRDMTILYQSDAQIKVLIVNEAILSKNELVREFQKARISERQKGYTVSSMINGNKILTDSEYLNNDVKSELDDLINESKISLDIAIDKLGETVLSREPISAIIAKCIELSKRIEVNQDYVLWLRNELYGYSDYLKNKPDIAEPDELPNNPIYRKINGEIRFSYTDEDTRQLRRERFDTSIFLHQSVSELESLIELTKNSSEFLLNVATAAFPPKVKDFFGHTKVPIVCKSNDLQKCLSQLRLELHKYLNEVLAKN